eukprot:Gregarina_sp_Poly_1__1127@NODE_1276_length_4519_cov_154_136119_g866_i0_p2_GENE_NODE_1276_length_4519_cov_154_136119_g866_i0NODE_1276_length_4519_cov_154_136119_g866_i0_p2_ORF_typecomplete_len391_score30_70InvAAD/PF18785_1/0_18_NODE_1276_length_4519_cov_154_136119_g866_i022113383
MPRNSSRGLFWMETPLRPRRRGAPDLYHVDDNVLPTAYSKVGQELLKAKYLDLDRRAVHRQTNPCPSQATLGVARTSFPTSLYETFPPCKERTEGSCPSCCRRAFDDCKEAWNHSHTHIDPWEIEVVSTSTARADSSRDSGSSVVSLRLQAMNESAIFGVDVSRVPSIETSFTLPCTQASLSTPVTTTVPVMSTSSTSMHLLLTQMMRPFIQLCSRKNSSPSNLNVAIGSSDPLECLTTTSPASSTTSHSVHRRPLPVTSERSQSVPRIRDATPPPLRRIQQAPRKTGPCCFGEKPVAAPVAAPVAVSVAGPVAAASECDILSAERIYDLKIKSTSCEVSSNLSTERVTEFDFISQELCSRNVRFLQHTGRVMWPRRDQRGRRIDQRTTT